MQEQVRILLEKLNIPFWGWNLIIVGLAVLLGLFIKLVVSLLLSRKAKENEGTPRYSLFRSLIRRLGLPLNFFIPLVVLNMLLPVMRMPPAGIYRLGKAIEIFLIICVAWILIPCIKIVQDFVLYRFDIKKADNLRERKIRTQLQFLRRFLVGLIVVLTIAAILLSFSSLRKVGTGLLTGVGLSGIIIGFAAQRSISNLLAGFQIAFTQPIRIDDAIIAEGEFGTVEEITLTYVVLRLWDERRLILPINYFLEKPFQNWTRTSAQMLGTVILYADFTLPVESIREELTRLLKSTQLWDGRVNAVQVTDVTENTMQLRALMSAKNSGENFDLRCYVRENLIRFIKENFADSLPKNRTVTNLAEIPEITIHEGEFEARKNQLR